MNVFIVSLFFDDFVGVLRQRGLLYFKWEPTLVNKEWELMSKESIMFWMKEYGVNGSLGSLCLEFLLAEGTLVLL